MQPCVFDCQCKRAELCVQPPPYKPLTWLKPDYTSLATNEATMKIEACPPYALGNQTRTSNQVYNHHLSKPNPAAFNLGVTTT